MEKYFENTGRRKRSVARVRVLEGGKVSTINGKPVTEYLKGFTKGELYVERPLIVTGLEKTYYFTAKVIGGGITGQADAIKLGMARAIVKMDEAKKPALKAEGLMTRDSRMVERKKYHHRKARKKPQFSKR